MLVFQAREYEDDIEDNSTFAEGDWDGDGDFTTADLVWAFREGNYVLAASPTDQVDSIFRSWPEKWHLGESAGSWDVNVSELDARLRRVL